MEMRQLLSLAMATTPSQHNSNLVCFDEIGALPVQFAQVWLLGRNADSLVHAQLLYGLRIQSLRISTIWRSNVLFRVGKGEPHPAIRMPFWQWCRHRS